MRPVPRYCPKPRGLRGKLGDLEGVRARIPYFKELGLTYLHLMPLFKAPEGENDGGYAVSSYREVHPPLGTMEQLASLAGDLRAAGISLVLDLIFNHTSDEHLWAERARAGEEVHGPCAEGPRRGGPDGVDVREGGRTARCDRGARAEG